MVSTRVIMAGVFVVAGVAGEATASPPLPDGAADASGASGDAVSEPERASASGASAAGDVVDGEVVASRSRWGAGRRFIVTESVLRAGDGTEVAVIQSGGSVDGIGMIQIPGQPVLRVGDRARVHLAARAQGASPSRSAGLARRVTVVERLDRAAAAPAPRSGRRSFDAGRQTAVQTTNANATGLFWASGCIFLSPDSGGTSHLPGDVELEVITQVVETWNQGFGECSFLELQLDPAAPREVGFDRVNVIKFRDDRWCRPATETEPEECHPRQAAGITTLFFVEDQDSARDGEIVDGDIELNAVDFSVSRDGETEDDSVICLSDLANTLTHEIGHLMGLDHTCSNGVGEQRTQDGDPVPLCTLGPSLPPEITEATMFAFQDCGETDKATPEVDDIDGVCRIYPLAEDPGTCLRADEEETAGCCSVTPGGPAPASPWASLWPLLALGVFTTLRRLRRR